MNVITIKTTNTESLISNSSDVLQVDSMCVDAYYIRSICLYEADNLEKGVQFLRQALQFAPDSPVILSLFRVGTRNLWLDYQEYKPINYAFPFFFYCRK